MRKRYSKRTTVRKASQKQRKKAKLRRSGSSSVTLDREEIGGDASGHSMTDFATESGI